MPNWCSNKLTVLGSYEEVQAFKDRAKGKTPWTRRCDMEQEENLLNFHSLVPVPENVLRAGYDHAGANWEGENWGCRWGASQVRFIDEWDGLVVYEFDTPWSPPLPFLESAAKQFPGLTFLLDYEEQSMRFKGNRPAPPSYG